MAISSSQLGQYPNIRYPNIRLAPTDTSWCLSLIKQDLYTTSKDTGGIDMIIKLWHREYFPGVKKINELIYLGLGSDLIKVGEKLEDHHLLLVD